MKLGKPRITSVLGIVTYWADLGQVALGQVRLGQVESDQVRFDGMGCIGLG